jgi:hypothetical protein
LRTIDGNGAFHGCKHKPHCGVLGCGFHPYVGIRRYRTSQSAIDLIIPFR